MDSSLDVKRSGGLLLIRYGEETLDGEALDDLLRLASGSERILLDLHGVLMMRSSGIGALVKMSAQLRPGGGRLVVCRLSRQLRDLFEMAGVSELLEIADTEAEAVARLGGD